MNDDDVPQALQRYADGLGSLSDTVEALGVNDGGVVLGMLREKGLAVPTLPEETARQQASQALPRLQRALKEDETMRDPARIPLMLEALRRAWERHPDQRLGQLVANAAGAMPAHLCEDDRMLEGLERLAPAGGLQEDQP